MWSNRNPSARYEIPPMCCWSEKSQRPPKQFTLLPLLLVVGEKRHQSSPSVNPVSHNSDQQDRVMSTMHVPGVNNCFLIALKAHSRGGNTCLLTADLDKNPWLWTLHLVKPQPLNQLLSFLINGRSTKFPSKLTSLYLWIN